MSPSSIPPEGLGEAYTEAQVGVYEVYPFLRNLPEGTWNTLCEREANVIVGLVRSAMRSGVVALSTHDGIMVPEPLEDTTKELLRSRYFKEFGIVPEVKAIRPGDTVFNDFPQHNMSEEKEEREHCVGENEPNTVPRGRGQPKNEEVARIMTDRKCSRRTAYRILKSANL